MQRFAGTLIAIVSAIAATLVVFASVFIGVSRG